MPAPRFGISTHLFHEVALSRDHLKQIAAHGFDCIELVASRSHFDYRNERAAGEVAEWLSDSGLRLHSVHAPVFAPTEGTGPGAWLSNAASDEARRQAALEETRTALSLSRHVPFNHLVVHLGVPTVAASATRDNHPAAARRSAEMLVELTANAGVGLAFELHQNALSSADALVRLLEEELEGTHASLCLDYGHGHLSGDLADTIETVAGHLSIAHVHDNDGRRDAHLVPFAGTIDWDAAMTETQKIGYEGVLMFEIAPHGDPLAQLARAARARTRLERALVTF